MTREKFELSEDVHLSVGGVVVFAGGFMHPYAFREMFGEEVYQELLKRPRVVTSYDVEDSGKPPN